LKPFLHYFNEADVDRNGIIDENDFRDIQLKMVKFLEINMLIMAEVVFILVENNFLWD